MTKVKFRYNMEYAENFAYLTNQNSQKLNN